MQTIPSLFVTPRLRSFLPLLEEFLHQEVYPLEKLLFSRPFADLEKNELATLRQKVKSAGWWTPHLPEKDGGMGLTLTEFGLVSQLLGTSPLGHYAFNCQAPDIGNMELLQRHASAMLQERYLKPLVKGQIRSCFSMTEPAFAGSNPVRLATTAKKIGNQYVINGHKWFTSSAEGAAFAIVMAVTNSEAPPHRRASMILVPTDTPGFVFLRRIPVMGETGSGYMSHSEIRYENCTVPVEYLIGKEGEGFQLAQERLGPGRIHHCMRWIGICERAFDLMCRYAVSRNLTENEPIASKQIVQQWIAESRAQIDAARLMVLHTAMGIDQYGAQAMRAQISAIKFFVAQTLMQVLDRAIQVHGALGITDDTILAFWYRHERGARIYDGPDEVHKYVVARQVLKNYGLKI
ncbi:MAG: acyl-CoA dehydrogenase family protein [Cytophagales bacterium]|nr:acyl-CoA dehydrogenase family protein [Bernardetiaceae bacterium]MDW8210256.1 acyl-CoA dehydrogenase family protein [Cytophagales bacterium]